MNKQIVFILGMHRSGTSALAGCFYNLGYKMGDNISTIGIEENPKGFYENNTLCYLNNKILETLKMSWDNVYSWEWNNQIEFENIKKDANNFINDECKDNTVILKDPRTCITLPFWQDVLKLLKLKYIYIVRHPFEVAESLKKRNKFEYSKSLNLWYEYNYSVLKHTKSYERCVIEYDSLVCNPKDTIKYILQKHNMNCNIDADVLNNFIEIKYKHYTLSQQDIKDKAKENKISLNDKVFFLWKEIRDLLSIIKN